MQVLRRRTVPEFPNATPFHGPVWRSEPASSKGCSNDQAVFPVRCNATERGRFAPSRSPRKPKRPQAMKSLRPSGGSTVGLEEPLSGWQLLSDTHATFPAIAPAEKASQ